MIPTLRCNELLKNDGLLIDSIYGKVVQEHRLKEQLHTRESAKSVFIRLLTVGAIRTCKTDIYLQ